MNLVRTLRKNRAAKRYARELAPWLRRNYGSSQWYTASQICAGVTALGLDENFIAIGYAAFMLKENFDALPPGVPVRLSYAEARAAFERFAPSEAYAASGEPVMSYDISGGLGDH